VETVVRNVYRTAGYGRGWHPAPEDLRIDADLCLEDLAEGEAAFRALADDQAICVGHASGDAGTGWLPPEHWLARSLARRLHALRTERPDLGLGPDGKAMVQVAEADGRWRLDAFNCALQQREDADDVALQRAVAQIVGTELRALAGTVPRLDQAVPSTITVNGAGAFDVGGPEGDNGLSGKKLVMDAYGPRIPIGGGALSGKDFWKADHAGALLARRFALSLVRLGLAKAATVMLGWHPGDAAARLLRVDAAGADPAVVGRPWERFEASLARSGSTWADAGPLVEIARWGHFGEGTRPWEAEPAL